MNRVEGVSAFALAALLSGCSLLTDPAVRLARCIERGVRRPAADALVCDPRARGPYLVLLHPIGELTTGELVAAGVPAASIGEVRRLRLGENAAIYVIPLDGRERPSRTTYQQRFVVIPRPLARVKRGAEPVTVLLASDAAQPAILGVQ